MAFIYDNLVATVISMTTFLILISIQTQATRDNTSRTSRNVAKAQVQELSTWLEEDLENMGRNMDEGTVPFESPDTSSKWHTDKFVFFYDSLDAGDTIRVKTRYELETTSTRTVDGENVQLYEVVRSRKIGSSGTWETKGQSRDLEYFEVNMLDKDANRVTNPTSNSGEIRSVRIRFATIAPFQNEDTFLRRVRRMVMVPYRLSEEQVF